MVDNKRDKEEVPIRWGRCSSILPHTFGAPDRIVNSKFLVKNADFISFYFPRNSRILFHFSSPEMVALEARAPSCCYWKFGARAPSGDCPNRGPFSGIP